MLFDTHAHVLSADRERYPYSTLRGGAKPPVSPVVFTVEDLVARDGRGGVDHACIVQRATIYGYDNRYALDAAAAFPKRFVPIVVLDAQDPASPGMLKGLASTRRLGGLRIVAPQLTEKDTAWLDSEEALGLWRAAADLALPVTVILYRRNNEAGARRVAGRRATLSRHADSHRPRRRSPCLDAGNAMRGVARASTTSFHRRPTLASPRASRSSVNSATSTSR